MSQSVNNCWKLTPQIRKGGLPGLPPLHGPSRRHLAQLHHHQREEVETAVSDATRAIYQALRAGTWIPGQRPRLRHIALGTWNQALADVLGVSPGQHDDNLSRPLRAVIGRWY